MLSWPQPSMNGPASDHGEVLKRTIPCARCRAASPPINVTPAVPGARAGVVAILRNKVPNEAHLLDWQNRSSPGEQNGVRDRLCYSRAQTFASDVVGPEVLARINSAQSRLLGSGREAGEVALRSLQRLRGDIKSELIAKVELQHFGSGKTDGTVGAGVRRVWSGLGRQREPIWIGVRVGIAVISGQFNCGHWPPEPVVVFSLEQGNRTIGETEVQQGKQTRAMGQTEVMSQRRGLRNFVPEVLNVAIPESSNLGLLRGASCAGDETQTLDFIENLCVLVARQLRRRSGAKFIRARNGKRSDLRPLCEVRWYEIGRRELVISRLVARDKRRRSDRCSVGAAER